MAESLPYTNTPIPDRDATDDMSSILKDLMKPTNTMFVFRAKNEGDRNDKYGDAPVGTLVIGTTVKALWRKADPGNWWDTMWTDQPVEVVQSGPGLGNELGIGTAGEGWSTTSELISVGTYNKISHRRSLWLQARNNSSSDYTIGANGSTGTDLNILNVSTGVWRPPRTKTSTGAYFTNAGGTFGGTFQLKSDGLLQMISGSPNTVIPNPGPGHLSIQVEFAWDEE